MVEQYKTRREEITKYAMILAVSSQMSYRSVMEMSYNERKLLEKVLKEKADAENPNTQRQDYL